MSALIEFRGVTKSFRSGDAAVSAVTDIDLTIERGEIFGIIGYSGAGKSTLLRLINALEHATSGSVIVDGRDLTTLRERDLRSVRAGIGMIFQQFNLFRSRTVFANIAYPLKVAGWPPDERKQRVAELLAFVGLTEKAWAYPDQLSGGQKQRVGIARALATNPAILLADEATSALDPETTADVLALLKRVNAELGVTIVVITHEMEVVRSIADRVAVLDSGRIIELGTVFDVFSDPQTATSQRFVGTVLRNQPGRPTSSGCAASTTAGSCRPASTTTAASARCSPTPSAGTGSGSRSSTAASRPFRAGRSGASPSNCSANRRRWTR